MRNYMIEYHEKMDKLLDEYVERSLEKRDMPLYDFIMSENFLTYMPGTVTILDGDELNCTVVPCEGKMILARSRYDSEKNTLVSEYAIYRLIEKDSFGDDTSSLNHNVFNCETTYAFESVDDGTYPSQAVAISNAVQKIYAMKGDE